AAVSNNDHAASARSLVSQLRTNPAKYLLIFSLLTCSALQSQKYITLESAALILAKFPAVQQAGLEMGPWSENSRATDFGHAAPSMWPLHGWELALIDALQSLACCQSTSLF